MTGRPPARPGERVAAGPDTPLRDGKYARVERERRFLLAVPPPDSAAGGPRRITDRYLNGTRLRLRHVDHLGSGAVELKLTQKVPAGRPGAVRGLITNIYLSQAEYDLLSGLPAAVLSKTRVSVSPAAIDVFDPPLHGLVLAEVEVDGDEEAARIRPPAGCVAEVTDDERFTGGSLARTRREDLLRWLAEYGIVPSLGA